MKISACTSKEVVIELCDESAILHIDRTPGLVEFRAPNIVPFAHDNGTSMLSRTFT